MTLQAETLLGPYRIQKQIGSGGMGEVYLAKDTRLGRTVALKVLPSNLAQNAQLKQRLEREALAISNLSHPNICTLHDIGTHDGKFFMVMEFIEGETLATHLTKRRLPLEDVLRYGIQIADALDKAHRKGIVHRDLKPGNIMITKSGVKLLDFGLAKFYNANRETVPTGVSLLPTGEDLTAAGTILGTLQYMAPEQLEGKDADARTDLFALGAILYEMATGKKAFTGSSQASIIAAILSSEVSPVSASEPMSPPQFDHVVRRCLAKNPEDRWQTASDVMHELEWTSSSSKSLQPTAIPAKRGMKWIPLLIISLVLLASAIFIGRAYFQRLSLGDRQPYAFSVVIPEEARVDLDYAQLALSPDGRRLVFVARDAAGKFRLWLRDLNSLELRALEGTQGATYPFWSPDSQWIAFFADMKLKKLKITESQPQILCSVGPDSGGGTWNNKGVILFCPFFEGPLYKISENGGSLEKVTNLNTSRGEANHAWPQFLPDQHHFLFHSLGNQSQGVFVGSLDSSETHPLMVSPQQVEVGRFAPPDYLLFTQDTDLIAQHFDLKTLKLSGRPTRIAEAITRLPWAEALFSLEKNVLAFRANVSRSRIQLVWFDRKGKELQRVGSPQSYEAISLSPDNRRAAVGRWESSSHRSIWLVDLLTGIESRFSFYTDDMLPVWSPDVNSLPSDQQKIPHQIYS
jgi:eukaryotic-like serine/threonine-protein kinase